MSDDDLSAFEIKQWADEEITRLRAEVERLTRERDEALVSKGVAVTMRLHAENRRKTAEARGADLVAARASHERLLLALSMTDGALRRVHGTPLRDLLVEWGIDEFWADRIDAALAPKEPECPPPSA